MKYNKKTQIRKIRTPEIPKEQEKRRTDKDVNMQTNNFGGN